MPGKSIPKGSGHFAQCQDCGSVVGSQYYPLAKSIGLHKKGTGHKKFKVLDGSRDSNPSELLLMGANPMKRSKQSLYDQFGKSDRLLLGRAGIGRKDITNEADVREARRIIGEMQRMKNRLPNPGCGVVESRAADRAQDLYEEFHETENTKCTVRDEPHMLSGDYTDLGKLVGLGVKPQPTGTTSYVQEISFPGKNIRVVCDPDGRHIYFVGDGQDLTEEDLTLFGADSTNRTKVGVCRHIAYQATKWHTQLAESVRGTSRAYQHEFGDEGGTPPALLYDRAMGRCLLDGGTYHVEGAGIVN